MRSNGFLAALAAMVVMASALSTLAARDAEDAAVEPAVAAKVRTAVENYVKQESSLKGGFFLRDAQAEVVRDLRFDYVHDGVKKTAAGQYYVCVDFLDQSQKRLDVDFYLLPTESGELKAAKIKIHKVDGVERKEK